ncbi:MAG: cobalt-precorrin 5A hydrolase [Bacillota bacterium]
MNDDQNTAVVTLTVGAKDLGKKIKNEWTKIDLYVPEQLKKMNDFEEGIIFYDCKLRELIEDLFENYNNIIFIMALGIVVRIISPYLQNKKVDPAVVTVDERGKNVISTLSGHLGGANKLTKKLADILNSNAVITTATDCQNKLAIDLLAQKIDSVIKPFKNLKFANAAIVNNNQLNIFSNYKLPLSDNQNINICPLSQLDTKLPKQGFTVIISNKNYDFEKEYLQLIPKNITVGIGCKRGIVKKKIENAIKKSLDKLNLQKESIKKLATIDLKADEKNLVAYADENNLSLDIIDRDKIKNANLKNISYSEFVKNTVGVAAVCEPAAILSSNNGKLILKKTKYDQVTIALVEEEIAID